MTQQISCLNFEEQINDRLDKRLSISDARELNVHAQNCRTCRVIFEEYCSLENGLYVFSGGKAVPSAITRQDEMMNSRRQWIISIAAILLIGLGLSFGLIPEKGSDSNFVATGPAILVEDIAQPMEQDSPVVKIPEPSQPAEAPTIETEFVTTTLMDWNQISKKLQPLNSYYQISAELPGVRPIQYSLGITLDWFQQTFFSSSQYKLTDPGFGVIMYETPGRVV